MSTGSNEHPAGWPNRARAESTLCGRRSACLALAGCIALFVSPAYAGSYLDRSALFLRGANYEINYVWRRLRDRELVRTVHELAAARVATARSMQVPKEVVQAHPHLLLVLANFERALIAAVEGEQERFVTHVLQAREEERTFRGVLKQLGWQLPEEER